MSKDSLTPEIQFRRCPFCGGLPERRFDSSESVWTLRCITSDCIISHLTLLFQDIEKAATYWNRREGGPGSNGQIH